MGCGSSAPAETPRGKPATPHLEKKSKIPPIKEETKEEKSSENGHKHGYVAFNVPLDENAEEKALNSNIDDILRKPLPKRLQRLAPLENAPKISSEQLQEKLKKAEEKRLGALEEKKVPSQRFSRRRSELLQAREAADTMTTDPLETKMATVERARSARLAAVQAKQRIRADRARKARERAQKLKEAGVTELGFEIEKYNDGSDTGETKRQDSDIDSWLEEDNNRTRAEKSSDSRLDSGIGKPMSSGYNSREISAGSVISANGDSDHILPALRSAVVMNGANERLKILADEDTDEAFFR